MTSRPDIPAEAPRLDALYRAKARAELAAAEAGGPKPSVRGQGDVLAEVLLVKGEPGSGDLAVGRALAGDDGTAIGKALDALGLPKERYALCTRGSADTGDARSVRLREITEAIDPRTVVLLDAVAAADFAAAFAVDVANAGERQRILGRHVVALDGFEASLGDETLKRRVWRQLQALAPAQKE